MRHSKPFLDDCKMKFYLGTDRPNWLWDKPPTHPLFISNRRLSTLKRLQPTSTTWALDSGGFTELNMFGEWRTSPKQYVSHIRRYQETIGNLDWAAPQDWMCEPYVLQKTKKTIRQHHDLTVDNFIELRTLAPELPIIPALQGWDVKDYFQHIDLYLKRGINLQNEVTVGMGSFCRRASFQSIQSMVAQLHEYGLKMHGFGVKQDGLKIFGNYLQSSDSMAWSFTARRASGRLCGHNHNAQKCSGCWEWATHWANKTVSKINTVPIQLEMIL